MGNNRRIKLKTANTKTSQLRLVFCYTKNAELQAYECGTPGQEIGVKNRR